MKILVVEDEHKIANSIKNGFVQEGWVVDVVFDGEEGFDLASSGDYDMLVLDLMLPSMSGEEVSKQLRNNGNHVPILMLTAKSTLDDKLSGFDAGADDYLTKPFAFEELLARVKALSRRPKKVDGERLIVNDVDLDSTTYEVKKKGKFIQLSKKEFQILEYLMKNRGKIISKEELTRRVWDYDSDILPNTIEVFVGFLRKKLGKNFIKTIRGFGYRV